MTKHFRRDLDLVRRDILGIGGLVETSIERALTALLDRRVDLAREVIAADEEVDRREVEVETDCLKILALHQPFAQDLRFLITVLKVNNDLERMGDLAVNIAESAEFLCSQDPVTLPADFGEMTNRVRRMVRQSLDALLDQNTDLAREVLAMDDAVDRLDQSMSMEVQGHLQKNTSSAERSVAILRSIRDLERIADLATNVAEDVVFLVEGELIRHGRSAMLDT